MMKYIALFILTVSILVVGCTTDATTEQIEQPVEEESIPSTADPINTNAQETGTQEEEEMEVPELDIPEEESNLPLWMTTEFKDVNTQETFTINDFKGKPILVESFAVWCPTCTRQQKETKKLHEDVGDDIVSIALDTDPNEDEQKVRDHTLRNGFDWRYAISPTDVTRSLIDDFGVGVVNAPSVPMILICPDQSFRQLKGGVKSVEFMKNEVAACG